MSYLQILSVESLDGSPTIVLWTENRRIIFDIGEGVQRLCVEHRVRLVKLDSIFLTRLVPETNAGLPGLFLTWTDTGINTRLSLTGPGRTAAYWHSLRHITNRPEFEMRIAECELYEIPKVVKYDDDGIAIHCLPFASISSSIATHICYICELPPQIGKFDVQKAKALGVPAGPSFGKLKSGQTITLADGSEVRSEQVLQQGESGRFFAIICNTNASSSIEHDDGIGEQIVSHPFWKHFRDGGQWAGQLECMVHLSPAETINTPWYSAFMVSFTCHSAIQKSMPLHLAAGKGACVAQSSFRAATRYCNKLHCISPSLFPRLHLDNHVDINATSGATLHALQAQSAVEHPPGIATNQVPSVNLVACAPLMKFHLLPPKRRGLESASSDIGDEEVKEFMAAQTSNLAFNSAVHEALQGREHIEAQSAGTASSQRAASGDSDGMITISVNRNGNMDATATMETLDNADTIKINEGRLLAARNNHLWFLGTGCAVPSKYRNVSGILLHIASNPCSPYGSSMLLDAGEGTWQQMIRAAYHTPSMLEAIEKHTDLSHSPVGDRVALLLAIQLRLVWISHPHADHHLGLIRIATERKRLMFRHKLAQCGSESTDGLPREEYAHFEPLVVIAPHSVLAQLDEYVRFVDPFLLDAITPVPCSALDPTPRGGTYREAGDGYGLGKSIEGSIFQGTEADRLLIARNVWSRMGIESISNVLVIHCQQSYGVCVQAQGDAFKLVYSGDTRPCPALIELGKDATILIHEATFDDTVPEEAVAKRHCTVSEALEVGVRMSACRTILTHFSQRYPNVPPMPVGQEANTMLAFDYLHLRMSDLLWAPLVTAAQAIAFPPEQDGEGDELEGEDDRQTGVPAVSGRTKRGGQCECGCVDAEFCSIALGQVVSKGPARKHKKKSD